MVLRNLRENLKVPDAKADLYLVGLGIGSFSSRTVEVDSILKSASLILHLTAFQNELLDNFNCEIIDLKELYESSDDARHVYNEMSKFIIEAVKDRNFLGHAAFLTYGNPLWLVDSNWNILARKNELPFTVKAIAASSFVDQVLIDLELRYDRAAQIFLADLFLNTAPRIDSRYALILPQIGDLGTLLLRQKNVDLTKLSQLFGIIQHEYPGSRKCHLIMSAWRSDIEPEIATTTVEDIFSVIVAIHTGSTLVIEGE